MSADEAPVDLRTIDGCFDGVIPPVLATCSAEGEPNITHLSQVYLVDEDHVGVSNQFFSKTAANVAANPRAALLVTDSNSYDTFQMDLHYERTETAGTLFDALKASLEAIASLMGMEDVFVLRGVDVYRVTSCRRVAFGATTA